MRGLAGTALVLLSTLGGFANALDTSTAVIPLDLRQHEFGRELILLLTVAESSEACGPSDIQINGQALSTKDERSGRDIIYEDYGSEIIAAWALECNEVDGKPVQQAITVQIESLDGVDYEDAIFTVEFHQSSPLAILRVDGPLVDVPKVDLSGEHGYDFWAQHHSEDGDPDAEIKAAISEIQFLRIQDREIVERIKVLEKFIHESDDGIGQCLGRFRCLVKNFFDVVTGIASKAYEKVMGPSKGHSHDEYLHRGGNNTNPAGPSRKRPQWRPPFCPCTPSAPPTTPPPPDLEPEKPPVADEKPDGSSDNSPDIPDYTNPHIEPPQLEVPSDGSEDDARKGIQKPPPVTGQHDFSAARRSFITILVLLLIVIGIVFLKRAKDLLVRWHRAHASHREERHRRRRQAFIGYLRSLMPGNRNTRCCQADMEQQRPPPVEDMQQRTQRSQSDASNTMEQDLAQFREAVNMVGDLVAAGEGRSQRTVDQATGGTTGVGHGSVALNRRPGIAEYTYPQDLPPAYDSEEEEDMPMLSAVADGFRQGYGSSGYSPRRGDSSSVSDDPLGYAKP